MSKILIVEDDIPMREVLARHLQTLNYEVFEATSGDEALEIVSEEAPQIILLDIQIPGLNGYEVCSKLRSDFRYNLIYIIFLTAHDTPSDLAKGLEFGGDDYIVKPWNVKELETRIEHALKIINDRVQVAFDPLTRLYNRYSINKFIQQELQRTKRYGAHFSLVLLEVDHFFKLYDEFGSIQTDFLLQELGEVLIQYWRKTDFVARWGGAEFMIALPSTDYKGSMLAAERICRLIAEHRFKRVGRITVSVGVSTFEENEFNFFMQVDSSLKLAKEAGKNCVR